jgi:ribosomal protein S18 acetylase RimI-like enzyme
VLVCEDEAGHISGSVMVGHDGHRGWLYYVASTPHSRGSGIGRQMVQAAEKWLRQRGVVKAQLLVRETNTKVIGHVRAQIPRRPGGGILPTAGGRAYRQGPL